eukprot:COSAG01_NODE_1642_length_9641_cov_14.964682_2_plen_220_part_00
MLTAMRRWTPVRTTYPARVTIMQTLVWSRPSFLAMYRTPPAPMMDMLYAASTYFLWHGRLPVRATVDATPQTFHCARRASRDVLSRLRKHGGLAWSDPRLHIIAQRAKWVPLLLAPDGENHRHDSLCWQSLPRYFLSKLGAGAGHIAGTSALLDEPNLLAMAAMAKLHPETKGITNDGNTLWQIAKEDVIIERKDGRNTGRICLGLNNNNRNVFTRIGT